MSIKLPYVKLGTMPFGPAIVKSKRNMPKVGDFISIKEDNKKSKYNNPWRMVVINKINDVCCFVELM